MCATMKYVSLTWMSIGTAPSMTPERPPITNIDRKPSANRNGVLKCNLPFQIVASQLKILIPVGTAISSVVTIIGTRNHDAMPETNMWCAHTLNPRTTIAISDSAINRYPNTGLRENTAMTSLMIPNPGSIMMYTAGCE